MYPLWRAIRPQEGRSLLRVYEAPPLRPVQPQDGPEGLGEAIMSGLHDGIVGWYDGLSRAGRDRVDQTLHVLAGFGIASLGTAAAAWEWAHRREFIEQAPIERVGDTQRDMRFVLYGAWGGQVVWTAWTTTVVVLLVT